MEILLNVFIIFANLILGLFIFVKNPKSATNIFFAALAWIFAVWTIFNYLSIHSTTAEQTLLWIRIILFLAAYKPMLLFLLFYTFPQDKLKLPTKWLTLVIIMPVLASILALTPLVFSHIEYIDGRPQPIPSYGMVVWILSFFGLLTASLILIIRRRMQAKGIIRDQLLYMLLGFTIAFTFFIFTNFILVNAFHNSSLVVVGPLFTIILVGFIFYSIARFRFLDIRLILARTVVYILLLGFIIGFYSIALFVIGAQILGLSIGTVNILLDGTITLVGVLTFQAFKKTIEKWTDKLLYKGIYNSDQLLKILSAYMSTTLELNNLTSEILKKLITEMRITNGVFILLQTNLLKVEFLVHQGYVNPPVFTEQDLGILIRNNGPVFFDSLEENELKIFMRSHNLSSILPLNVKDIRIGFLLLGDKASGETYSQQDINLLEILAPAMSVALQNSKEYEEIKRFNITLREEIDRATRQLRVANSKLEELDQLKDDFVSVASHELRTPMTSIRSYAWMALYRSDIALSEKMKRYLSRTIISTERLINLVNEMLNISRIESGRVGIKPEVFNLMTLVKDVFEEVSIKAAEKHITLRMDQANIPNVFADSGKVHQVLLNLLGNSLKFTPENGLIEVKFASNQTVVGIGIKDNGVGITKEDLHRLFKKFGRLENSYVTAGTTGGTGLGLYVCRSLVQLMGGEIWVESEGIGKGSTFFFTLPAANQDTIAHSERYQTNPVGESKTLEPVAL